MQLFNLKKFTEAKIGSGESVFVTLLNETTARIESIPITSRQFAYGDIVRIQIQKDERPMITEVITPSGHQTAVIRLAWDPFYRPVLKNLKREAVVWVVDIDLVAVSCEKGRMLDVLRPLESADWSHYMVHDHSPVKPATEGRRGLLDVTYFAKLWRGERDLTTQPQEL